MEMLAEETAIYQRPVELLQKLIRFDTTNPPGNEGECIQYIDHLLTDAGVQTRILAKDPARPNLIARLPGRGDVPPLLVYAHVDVVSTENQRWQYPPFEGRIVDGLLWGRGTLDDKGGAAMSISAFLRARAEGLIPPGDVILAMLCDEEQGGNYGAKFLIEEHPEQFAGVRYAIGETGGFSLYIGNQKFYPIMVAEKQYCVIQVAIRGSASYATSVVTSGSTAAKAGALLTRLEKRQLPVHMTPVVQLMVGTISKNMPLPAGPVMRLLLKPALTDKVLNLLGSQGRVMIPLFHNTCTVIGVSGGEQIITTPAKILVNLGIGLLPGFDLKEILDMIREITGAEVEYEVLYLGNPGPERPDMGLYNTLGQILREADPDGVPLPLMLTAPTDASNFNRLGIQTFGFQPMKLTPNIEIEKLAHAADERIPVEAVEFGTHAIYQAMQRFG